jgi:hypothetical protein
MIMVMVGTASEHGKKKPCVEKKRKMLAAQRLAQGYRAWVVGQLQAGLMTSIAWRSQREINQPFTFGSIHFSLFVVVKYLC